MKTIFDHIDRVKEQPHHIRKQVAFASAATLTALIALVWLAGSISTGAFAIRDGSFTGGAGQQNTSATGGDFNSQNLAGVGAAATLQQSADMPAYIKIIDAASAAPAQMEAEQTTIPF